MKIRNLFLKLIAALVVFNFIACSHDASGSGKKDGGSSFPEKTVEKTPEELNLPAITAVNDIVVESTEVADVEFKDGKIKVKSKKAGTTKVTLTDTNNQIVIFIITVNADGTFTITPEDPEDTVVEPQDMLAASSTVQFEFDCDGLGYKIAFENNAEGTPVYKLCLQENEANNYDDATEIYKDFMNAEIDGDVYTFVMASYACAIDTANKTYSWIFLDRYEDSADTFTNAHIYVNGTDIIGDLTYKTFVKPTAEDMLAPGAKVEINYIVDPVNLKLSWQNDAEGNPINAYLQEYEPDGSKGYGEECSGVFQNDEYIFDLSWEYLRVNPKKKTYTFYIEDIRNPEDSGDINTLTSIKINGVDISGDFEYETFVKPTAATMLEAGTTVRFSVNDSVYKYIVTFKNNASGMPVLQQILVSPPYPAADVTESDKNRFTASIQEGIYKYNHGDFELTIDTANATYTWCNNEADAKASIHDATIYVNNLDITDDLTYKAYAEPAVPEDMLKPGAETKISFTSGTSNYEITWVINQYGYAGFKFPGGIVVNGQDKTEDYGSTCNVSIKNGVLNYHHFTVDFDVDPVNRTFKWYQKFGAPPKMDNTTVTVNGTDITELLTDVTPSVEDIVAPNSTIQITFKEGSDSYKLIWKNDAEGKPVVQSLVVGGSTDITGMATVDVLNGEYLFAFGLYRLRINPKNKTYTWFTRDYADAESEIENTNIFINGTMFTDSFTYQTYLPVEALLAPYAKVYLSFNYDLINYKANCENGEDGTPVIDFENTWWDAGLEENLLTNSMKSQWSVKIEGYKYILTIEDAVLTIDVADRTYTWCNTKIMKDGKNNSNSNTFFIIDGSYIDITPALTYKPYVQSN